MNYHREFFGVADADQDEVLRRDAAKRRDAFSEFLTLERFTLRYSLPKSAWIVKAHDDGTGMPCPERVLFHSIASIRHVVADELSTSSHLGRVTLQSTGRTCLFFVQFKGWLEVLVETGNHFSAFPSVVESVRTLVEMASRHFLVKQSSSCFVRSTSGELVPRQLLAGQSVTLVGTVTLPGNMTRYGKQSKELRFVRCLDSNGIDVFLSMEESCSFIPIAEHDQLNGAQSLQSILYKLQLPIVVRLVHVDVDSDGRDVPSTTGIFRLTRTYTEEMVFGVPFHTTSANEPLIALSTNSKAVKVTPDHSTTSGDYGPSNRDGRCDFLINQYLNKMNFLPSAPRKTVTFDLNTGSSADSFKLPSGWSTLTLLEESTDMTSCSSSRRVVQTLGSFERSYRNSDPNSTDSGIDLPRCSTAGLGHDTKFYGAPSSTQSGTQVCPGVSSGVNPTPLDFKNQSNVFNSRVNCKPSWRNSISLDTATQHQTAWNRPSGVWNTGIKIDVTVVPNSRMNVYEEIPTNCVPDATDGMDNSQHYSGNDVQRSVADVRKYDSTNSSSTNRSASYFRSRPNSWAVGSQNRSLSELSGSHRDISFPSLSPIVEFSPPPPLPPRRKYYPADQTLSILSNPSSTQQTTPIAQTLSTYPNSLGRVSPKPLQHVWQSSSAPNTDENGRTSSFKPQPSSSSSSSSATTKVSSLTRTLMEKFRRWRLTPRNSAAEDACGNKPKQWQESGSGSKGNVSISHDSNNYSN